MFVLTVTVVSLLSVPLIGKAYDTTNLISWWSCDETSGVRADSHGSVDLTDNNTVGYGTGVQGNACDFESTNSEYLSSADTTAHPLELTDTDFTVGAWFKRESDASPQTIFSKLDGSGVDQRSWGLLVDILDHTDVGALTGSGSGTYQWDSIDYTFTPTTWYFVVVTYETSSGNLVFYVNDVAGTTQSGQSSAGFDVTAYFSIGAYKEGASPTGFFDGLIDEAFVFDTILATDTISALYNDGVGLTYAEFVSGGATTSTSTATTTSTTIDVSELIWIMELYLSMFMFLLFTYIGYRFTKLFI